MCRFNDFLSGVFVAKTGVVVLTNLLGMPPHEWWWAAIFMTTALVLWSLGSAYRE